MRRRRKTKYTWLPIQNGATFGGADTADRSIQQLDLSVPNDGSNVTGIIPVVADLPQGSLTTVETEGIGEIIGNEYVLKRIVGSCFVEAVYATTETTLEAIGSTALWVTCGWFVARSDPANPNLPVAFSTEGNQLYSTQNAFLTRQPWIWRRSWLLGPGVTGNPLSLAGGGTAVGSGFTLFGRYTLPATNVAYGSVQDGPHVNAKTGRRIRLEERLWFAASAVTLSAAGGGEPSQVEQSAIIHLDCRYLGALRRPRSRSNFA